MLDRTTSRRTLRRRVIRRKPAGWPLVGAPPAGRQPMRGKGKFFTVLLLLLNACTPGTAPMVKLHGVPVSSFEQELDQACGQPIAYPLRAQCIDLMGSAGPMLAHRSLLVMKIWRSCPQDNPCYRIVKTDPACGEQAPTAVSEHGGRATDSCTRAQEADYSCAALRDDLVYVDRVRQASSAQGDSDCAQAQMTLADFDKKIEEMSVRIQWYRIFARKGF